MRKVFIAVLLLSSCTTYSDAGTSVFLKKLSDSKECLQPNNWEITNDLDEFENFSIPNNDYLTIQLLSKNSVKCYEFKYHPEASANINTYWKDGYLYVVEMTGSTINGNWLEKKYIFDQNKRLLKDPQTKLITFHTDDNGNSTKNEIYLE